MVLLLQQLAVLAALVAAPPAPLDVRTELVDPQRTETGLRARTGDALAGWTITVTQATEPRTVDVRLRAPDGSIRARRVALQGESAEDRSRELAASLTLLMDEPGDPAPAAPPTPPPVVAPAAAAPAIRGWLGAGPRIVLGRGLHAEGGLDLMGGAWLVRDHLQPIASLGLTGAAQAGVSLLHVRIGAGLAVGAPLPDPRIWLGAHVLTHALWARAHDARTATAWQSSTEIGALAQYRGQRLLLGLRTGLDLTLPPLTIHGTRADLRRARARWAFGLMIGLAFG